MLNAVTPDEVLSLLECAFAPHPRETLVSLEDALGRVLFEDIVAAACVPDFDRSTVDGYAVRAKDTFGCSDGLPALLRLEGEIIMGHAAPDGLRPGGCMAVPTGGAMPGGADAAVMLEYTERYGDGTIGVTKPVAPGQNLIFRGDDAHPGQIVLQKGRRLTVTDLGALAALGVTRVAVCRPLTVGVISTGDELVPVDKAPLAGQVRDVNTTLLCAVARQSGAAVRSFGIIPDDEARLGRAVDEAVAACDVVLISGGSSVGAKDATHRVIEKRGELLFHGVAMKPGKPTLLGSVAGKPVWGLPGHPVAAFFVARLFVLPLLMRLNGEISREETVSATLTEAVSANDGRAQYLGVKLSGEGAERRASPIHSKSGLIATLSGCDGFFCIPRDCEGLPQGAAVAVTLLQ